MRPHDRRLLILWGVTLLVFLAPQGVALADLGGGDMDDCTGWSAWGACGGGSCPSAQRIRTRTCTTPGFPTSECSGFDQSCCTYGGWTYGECGAGCSVGHKLGTRTSSTSPLCAPQTECHPFSSCPQCNYTREAISACGAGSCPVGQKRFQYTSVLCGFYTQCEADGGCPTCNYVTSYSACNAGGCGVGYKRATLTSALLGCPPQDGGCVAFSSCPGCNYVNAGPVPDVCGGGGCAMTQKRFKYTSGLCPTDFRCEGAAGCPPPDPWVPYGFIEPMDPTYNFGQPSNTRKGFLGLAAKGNIVIGDYRDDYRGIPNDPKDFPGQVAPKLTAGQEGAVTRPYAVDPSDAALGYDNDVSTSCGGRSPCFDGNYDQVDEHGSGRKWAPDGGTGGPRKFYESSLPDAEFGALVDPRLMNPDSTNTTPITIDAVLYTNHALAGLVKALHLVINGARVSRDDALVWNKSLVVNHDPRLIGDRALQAYIALPFTIRRPQLTSWQECPPTGCP